MSANEPQTRGPAAKTSAASLQDLQAAFARMLADDQSDASPAEPAVLPATDQGARESPDDFAAETDRVTQLSIVESMLFVGHPQHEPMSSRMLAAVMRGVTPGEVDDMVLQLNQQYEADGNPYQIVAVGDGYRMVLREEFDPLRHQFLGRVRHAKLSQTAVDVLAIVAYRQPITCEAVDSLRNRPSSGILRMLVQRELLQVERSPETRERLYATTQRFLDLLELDSIDDLPQAEDLERSVR